ncbi:DNA replication complex GINS protein [Blastocystis sp. subtype 4]|uniref:DNA replication complex GINS protein n=1 Tax=Blastocystis sp. subtype 4 TaxID=944170 RepID=UPI000712022D|nr:DNA replication complex GINS protein [Blastocystis sp. subtype 4]KNB45694.1 DNA replication complex GINS protein [Blastocystis sp. subtype 4]|eukprot:XP_014529137.1 DNA replication complex GINS protein [Blastocystis sp. subtype 4]
MRKLEMICGEYGPFEPLERAKVPLWLALILKRNNKCRVVMPDWMSPDNLRKSLEADRNTDIKSNYSLVELPEHYIEISRLLLESCEDDIQDVREVRSLIDTLIKVRENRLSEFRGVVFSYVSSTLEQEYKKDESREFVRRPFYDIINGASAVEVNRLFSQFLPVMEEINKSEDTRFHLMNPK